MLICPAVHAASFGHSRVVSAPGQALRIDVPVSQLSADDLRSFSVSPAPMAAWSEAGLIPPVDLATLTTQLVDGYAPGSKVIQLRSSQPFNRPVADVLLDVHTASGRQRYQVSLLTRTDASIDLASVAGPEGGMPVSDHKAGASIRVKTGDTMFAIARRHAVRGVSDYQMMMALFRANPKAFIHENVNLVRAGSTLVMPDKAALTAISDREARRLFMQHAQAFARYRRASAGVVPVVGQQGAAAAAGDVVQAMPSESAQAPADTRKQDLLRLSDQPSASAAGAANGQAGSGAAGDSAGTSAAGAQTAQSDAGKSVAGPSAQAGGNADGRADDEAALRKGVADAEQRVSQLESNVKNLNEALRAQGSVLGELVVEGAKGLSESIAQATSPSGDGAPSSADAAMAGGAPSSADTATAGGAPSPADAAGGAPGMAPSAGAAGDNRASATAPSANGASSSAAAPSANGASSPATAPSARGSTSAVAPSGNGTPSSDAAKPSNGAAPSAAAVADTAVSSAGAAAGSQAAASSGEGASNGTSPSAGSAASNGAPSSAGPSAGGGQGSAAANGSAGRNAPGGESTAGAGKGGTAAGTDGGSGTADSISTKTENTVSWFQEHMLGVITGLLALVVLIIAWLLRRANAARDEGRDDSSGLITEAMVREKLAQINLDLDQNSPDRNLPGSR